MYTIKIHKDNVLFDIDAIIHKTMDVQNIEDKIVSYNIRTDDSPLDRSILNRMLDKRHADLCQMLLAYLRNEGAESVNNDVSGVEGEYIFNLEMPTNWSNLLLKPLSEYIHQYLVYGTLLDYYLNNMPELAKTIELDYFVSRIKSVINLRLGGTKRPLQPF